MRFFSISVASRIENVFDFTGDRFDFFRYVRVVVGAIVGLFRRVV